MKLGFTFTMKVELVYPLTQGSIWQLIEEPKEEPDIAKYKPTAKFARLKLEKNTGLRLLDGKNSKTIRLSPEAIKRYLELAYIEKYWRDGYA
jgi:hypothetical protein